MARGPVLHRQKQSSRQSFAHSGEEGEGTCTEHTVGFHSSG